MSFKLVFNCFSDKKSLDKKVKIFYPYCNPISYNNYMKSMLYYIKAYGVYETGMRFWERKLLMNCLKGKMIRCIHRHTRMCRRCSRCYIGK